MKMARFSRFLTAGIFLGLTGLLSAVTLTQELSSNETMTGQPVTLTLKLINSGSVEFSLNPPLVPGLEYVSMQSSQENSFINGVSSSQVTAVLVIVPTRAGDFTIPAFDLQGNDGQSIHVKAMSLHVLSPGAAPQPNASSGPVVMPPSGQAPPPPPAADSSGALVPRDPDGRPGKFFIILTPETTEAYVGQSVPMKVDCYIRQDVMAQQDSLPTLNGTDFLLTPLNTRPIELSAQVGDDSYELTSWTTALTAAKPGDYVVQMARETNWANPQAAASLDPFNNPFNNPFMRQPTERTSVVSNRFTLHVHALPQEGRPADFNGAIGFYSIQADAAPTQVTLGEPVIARFQISGQGNFDSVFCPAFSADPAWKSYQPESKITYHNEAHTQADKVFSQPLIPQKNGPLPLPAVQFSYFNPQSKQYVSLPIHLPRITVTGTTEAALPVTTSDGSAFHAAPVPQNPAELTPNRPALGPMVAVLGPVLLQQPWFLPLQAVLALLCLTGLLLHVSQLPSRRQGRQEQSRQKKTVLAQTSALHEAARLGDARAFFLAARSAVQLRLGLEWKVPPAGLTLTEIRERDPALGEKLAPLFQQADELVYSGRVPGAIDLTAWETELRELLSRPTLSS